MLTTFGIVGWKCRWRLELGGWWEKGGLKVVLTCRTTIREFIHAGPPSRRWFYRALICALLPDPNCMLRHPIDVGNLTCIELYETAITVWIHVSALSSLQLRVLWWDNLEFVLYGHGHRHGHWACFWAISQLHLIVPTINWCMFVTVFPNNVWATR